MSIMVFGVNAWESISRTHLFQGEEEDCRANPDKYWATTEDDWGNLKYECKDWYGSIEKTNCIETDGYEWKTLDSGHEYCGPTDCPEDTPICHTCPDPNRKTYEDGSCSWECKDGWKHELNPQLRGPRLNDKCIKIIYACKTPNSKVNNDGSCASGCNLGYKETATGECVEDNSEPLNFPFGLTMGIAVVAGMLMVI